MEREARKYAEEQAEAYRDKAANLDQRLQRQMEQVRACVAGQLLRADAPAWGAELLGSRWPPPLFCCWLLWRWGAPLWPAGLGCHWRQAAWGAAPAAHHCKMRVAWSRQLCATDWQQAEPGADLGRP